MSVVAEFEKLLVKGPDEDGDNDGCEHGDYGSDSDADSPDTDAG